MAQVQRSFDLTQGPLLRISLLRLANDDHVLLLTMHHIIFDGWSMSVLVGELVALYSAYSTGQPAALPALPIQYADYSVWQAQRLAGTTLAEHLDFWRKQFSGAPEVLEILMDHERPSRQTYRGAQERFEVSSALTRQLR